MRAIARALFLGVLLAGCAGGRGGPGEILHLGGAPTLTDTVVQSGLSVPWDLAFAPDGRLFVTERMGTILMFESAKPNAKKLGSMRVPDVHSMGEAGLMGITIDPRFTTNGFLYVCASRMDGGDWRNQILRYKASADTMSLDGYVIRSGILAASIHDGCRLAFGSDGKLWATMGENGNGKLAQDPNTLNGKILRANTIGKPGQLGLGTRRNRNRVHHLLGGQSSWNRVGEVDAVVMVPLIGSDREAVRAATDDLANQVLNVEAALDEVVCQSIEEFGINRRIGGANIVDRIDDSPSEEIAPDPINI